MSSRFDMSQAITKAILETVGTDFFLKTGARKMTGDIDVDTHDIRSDAVLLEFYASGISLWNLARSARRDIEPRNIYFYNTVSSQLAATTFRAKSTSGSKVDFQGYDGAAWQNCLTLENPGNIPQVSIPRASDIGFLAGKNLKLYYGDYNVDMEGATSPLTVNFSPAMPDTNYMLKLSWNVGTALWWSTKTTSSFKINFLPSPGQAGTLLDWMMLRTSW